VFSPPGEIGRVARQSLSLKPMACLWTSGSRECAVSGSEDQPGNRVNAIQFSWLFRTGFLQSWTWRPVHFNDSIEDLIGQIFFNEFHRNFLRPKNKYLFEWES
jgi:hypothetical protein